MSGEKKRWPGESDEAHPEVFTKMPPQPSEKKPGQLPESMIRKYFEDGYVVVENFFTKEELDPCRATIEELVENLAEKLVKGGKIKNGYKECGLFERLAKLNSEFPGAAVLLHKIYSMPKAFADVWTNERLLNVVEQLIGPEIMGHPVWNLRTKTPRNEETTVPWHQDSGYLDNDSYSTHQCTAWIPLLDANERNGCLQMAERGHRTGKVAQHTCCAGNTWYINLDEKEMAKTLGVDLEKDLKILPVKYGGMVLFSNLIPHRSLENFSDQVRWSLDLRWQTPSKPVGFYGLKEGILFRSPKHPDHKPNWDEFNAIDRHKRGAADSEAKEDEFDTIISGPWMLKWEMTHQNRHTAALKEGFPGYTKA